MPLVDANDSEAEASDELRVLFPSPALDQLDASAYLAATVLPSVNEAMASLCASRPADAHGALECARCSPSASSTVTSVRGTTFESNPPAAAEEARRGRGPEP